MKKSVFAVASLLAASTTFAADIPWIGDGSYDIGSDDTMTFSSDTTITAASTFTGSGTIIVSGGMLNLAYPMDNIPFAGFTGTVQIDSGAKVYAKGGDNFKEDGTYNNSAFGPTATIKFNGGTYEGFPRENNSQFHNPIILADKTESILKNTKASSGSGVNLRFREESPFSGGGKLTIEQNDRWIEFTSGIDFSSFTGGIVLTGTSSAEAMFWGTGYGDSAAWTFDASREFRIGPGNSKTSSFGALTVTGKPTSIKLTDTGSTLKVGSRSGTDSSIATPFTGNSFTLNKVGADTKLTLGSAVTFVDGTTLDIDEGTLELDGCDISGVTADFASGTTLKVTANGGTVAVGSSFGNVDLTAGILTIPAGDWADGATPTLFTYSGLTGFTTDKITITGLGGNATAVVSDDGSGTVTAAVAIPTLEWKGTGTDWTDANAWTSGGKTYTFADGDKVTIPDGATIELSSTVRPASVTIAGSATLNGEGTVETAAISNGGTLNIAGSVTLKATPVNGIYNVDQTGTLTFVDTRTIETGPNFTGMGLIVFDGANVLLHHSILNASVPFVNFAGTVKLTGGAVVEQSGDGIEYPSDNDNLIAGPFGDTAKVVFAGGTLKGYKVANNIFFHNEFVVQESEIDNWLEFLFANNYSQRPNVKFCNKFTGAGTLKMLYNWDNSNKTARRLYFTSGCDMSEFAGTIFISGGHYVQFDTALDASNATISFDSGNGPADNVYIQPPSGSTVKFGALNYSRSGNRLQVWNGSNDFTMTMEIGGKSEDCAIDTQFHDKAFDLVKKGDAKLTIGAGFGMVSGSTVRVDGGTLAVNCETALVAPVTVTSGTVLAGTGTVSTVTFEDGAKVDFGALPENPARGATVYGITASSFTWTQKPAVVQPEDIKGKWKLGSRDNGDSTYTLYAEFAKPGFVLIVK